MTELPNELRSLCHVLDRHAECRNRIDYRCIVCEAADEIERLRAIVDALPKTEDGNEIVPGIELWATGEILYSNGAVMLVKAHRCTAEMDTSFHSQFVGKFYSTREAASAAGGEE